MDILFISLLFKHPMMFFMIALVVVFSVCLHECLHALVALWEGDPTAADAGHLTLNPLRQMGVISLIMFCLMGICWGSVPVNPRNFKSRWSDLRVSLAGPFANFALFAIAWLGYGFIATHSGGDIRQNETLLAGLALIYTLGEYNFVLMVLNLIPAPGLDGWPVLCSLFPSIARTTSEFAKGFMIFIIVAALLFVPYIFRIGELIMALAPKAMF